MKLALVLVLLTALSLSAAIPLSAATATYTGNFRYITTVTNQPGISCEYRLPTGTFWKTFLGSPPCPQTVEVE